MASCTSRAAFCSDEENERMRPKKSSGFGASGESGISPKNASMERSSLSNEVAMFFKESTTELI